jgi:ankyrin repeat protein
VNVSNHNGFAPLMFGVGKREIRCALLDYGADPFYTTTDGTNLLHFSAALGNLEAIRWAMNVGIDPSQSNDRGQRPIDMIHRFPSEKKDQIRRLLQSGATGT